MHYLSAIVPPYSYGQEWVLLGEPFHTHIAVPYQWIGNIGESVIRLSPQWLVSAHPEQIELRSGTQWEILTGEQVKGSGWGEPYCIATDDTKIARLLLSEAKAISFLQKEEYFTRRSLAEANVSKYRFCYVFRDWLGIGLKGLVLEGTDKPLSKEIQDIFYRRGHSY